MGFNRCPHCQRICEDGKILCDYCGSPLEAVEEQEQVNTPKRKRTWLLIAGGAVVLALIIGFVVWFNYTGWINEYYIVNGKKATGLTKVGDSTYYFDEDGNFQTGFQIVNGKKYYFDNQGKLHYGWLRIGADRYFFGEDGVLRTGFQTIDQVVYYFDENGRRYSGWLDYMDNKYYFDIDGIMQTGLCDVGYRSFLFDPEGVMLTGMQTYSGSHYLFAEDGEMLTGFQTYENKKYYFARDGKMQFGLRKAGTSWIYCDSEGVVHEGWLELNDKKYFCSPQNSGIMAVGRWKIDGVNYYFNSNGEMMTGEVSANSYNYEFDENGKLIYSQKIDKNMTTEASDAPKAFYSRTGAKAEVYFRELRTPVTDARSLQIEIKIDDSPGAAGTWRVNVRTLDGAWKSIGSFTVDANGGTFSADLKYPISFDAFICTPYDTGSFFAIVDQTLVEVGYQKQTEFVALDGEETTSE